MADADFSLMPEHFKRIHAEMGALKTGQATIIPRLNSVSSHLPAFHVNDAAQDATIAEINIRLDRIERRLDLREEA